MSERKKIIPAVARFDRSASQALHGASLTGCFPGGSAGLAAGATALGQVALAMKLGRLTQGEAGVLSADGHEAVAHAIEAALRRCQDVRLATGVDPDESQRTRLLIIELGRVIEAGQLFGSGVIGGRRLVAGLLSYACLNLVEHLEREVRIEGQQALLGETAGLRGRVRAYLAKLEVQKKKAEKTLTELEKSAVETEDRLDTAETLQAVREGAAPNDEAVRQTAARLSEMEEKKGGRRYTRH